jgi:type I restriction enzyme S subunit
VKDLKTIPLGNAVTQMKTGSTPSTTHPEFFDGDIPWFTPGDIGSSKNLTYSARTISQDAVSFGKAKIFEKGMLLVTCIGDIGRVGVLQQTSSSNQQITALKFNDDIDTNFAYYWFILNKQELVNQANQAVVPILNNERLSEINFAYPPLTEQKRIASLLARADRLRQLRRTAHDLSDTILQSVFLEMFGDVRGKTKEELLGNISNIASGVTKGQNYNGRKTVEVPYLRVANVQDGYLDLSEIKTIQALPSEIEELRLKPGDVVMTEGGDFDKLGRGAIWRGEIENCIHQNHIFRVRLDTKKVMPEFFENYLLSPEAKDYFLIASKQTTNLASINMTQLKRLPVPLYPLNLQEEFAGVVSRVESLRRRMGESARQVEGLFESLLAESFG